MHYFSPLCIIPQFSFPLDGSSAPWTDPGIRAAGTCKFRGRCPECWNVDHAPGFPHRDLKGTEDKSNQAKSLHLCLSFCTHARARTHAHTLRRASWGRRVRASVEERCGGPVVTCAEWAEQRDAPSLSPQEDRLLFSTFLLTSDNLTVDICFSPFPTVNTTTGFIYAYIYIYIYVLQWIIIKWNVLYVIFMPSVREER